MSRYIDADKLENDIVENITVKAVSRMLAITQGQPKVKAIPIEWIKMFLEENYPIESPYGTKAYFHDFMKHMIKEWEKENETN